MRGPPQSRAKRSPRGSARSSRSSAWRSASETSGAFRTSWGSSAARRSCSSTCFVAVAIGVPALMAEFALGRFARRGPVGAFKAAGFPVGTAVGWFFFVIVIAATGYYTAVVGWVLYYAVAQIGAGVGLHVDAVGDSAAGSRVRLHVVRAAAGLTAIVTLACAVVVVRRAERRDRAREHVGHAGAARRAHAADGPVADAARRDGGRALVHPQIPLGGSHADA